MKITTISLSPISIFDEKIDFKRLNRLSPNAYCIGTSLLQKILKETDLPISYRNVCIKKIFEFLMCLDTRVESIILNKEEVYPIPQCILIEIFSRNSYVKYLDLFKKWGVLTPVTVTIDGDFFVIGDETTDGICKHFRLNKSYQNEDISLAFIYDKNKREFITEGKYPKRYCDTIENFTLDLESAITDEMRLNNTNNKKRKRIQNILSTYKKRFIKPGEKQDRIYNSISNISKVSRDHIYYKGESFANIDITGSQPLLLSYYLKSHNLPFDEAYIDDTTNGMFYERFMSVTEYKDRIIEGIRGSKKGNTKIKNKKVTTRDEMVQVASLFTTENCSGYQIARQNVKKLLYKNIFFLFQKDAQIALEFKRLYPTTYDTLMLISVQNKVKKKAGLPYDEMASILQNMEASIFNTLVPKKSKGYFTLFDAIYFTDVADRKQLEKEIMIKFSVYGLVPKLKFEVGKKLSIQQQKRIMNL